MPNPPDLLPERELRLAVVMYGGVSLAIYMNGATQELLNLVRATAANPADPNRARFADGDLTGSARLYRQLARLPLRDGNMDPDPRDPQAPIGQRFIVDILSGTSAGGINAIFLAKALSNGQPIDGLTRLWQTEADIGLLINDAESRQAITDLPRIRNPKSLLNSQRMFRKLLDAFDEMDSTSSPAAPLVDDVNLYVTATDLEGLPVRLQLGGGEIAEERCFRKSFHLMRTDNRNDFERTDNPFLAFIARCTSSFPVAFEPMQFAEMAALLKMIRRPLPATTGTGGQVSSTRIPDRWRRHFDEYDASEDGLAHPLMRPFADGGYLDNKPFSYALDAIVERQGGYSAPVERKLVYIEPDPERLSRRHSHEHAQPPNAIENVLSVIQLQSYETIREELLRVRDRNRLVEKIRSVVAGVDSDFQALATSPHGTPAGPLNALADTIARQDEFNDRALEQMVKVFGSAYGGYHRLKVGQLTDDLSQIVAAHVGIPVTSDEFRAFRLLVRAWRNARYAPNPTGSIDNPLSNRRYDSEFRFLSDFDLSYRIRRASFTVEQINRLGVLTPRELAVEFGQHPAICGGDTAKMIAAERARELSLAFGVLRRGLGESIKNLRSAREALLSPEPGKFLSEIAGHAVTVKQIAEKLMAQPSDRQRWKMVDDLVEVGGELEQILIGIQSAVKARVNEAVVGAREKCWDLLETDGKPHLASPEPTDEMQVARFIGRHYYTWFELYDSMLFPITHGSQVGEEIAIVEPIRISPLTGRDDAGFSIPNPRLMPAGIAAGHFGAFLNTDWRARDILIGRLNSAEKLVRMILSGTSHDNPEEIAKYINLAHGAILEEECARIGSVVGQRLISVYNLTTPADRLAFLKQEGLQPEGLPPAAAIGWIARSVKVLGRVLREASQQPAVRRGASWLLYAGHILTGMIEVLVPHKLWGVILRLWIPRLLVFAVALIVLGALLGKEQVTGLGWTVVWISAAFTTLTLFLRGIINKRGSWFWRGVTTLLALVGTVLLLIGISYVPNAANALKGRVRSYFETPVVEPSPSVRPVGKAPE